MVVRPLAALPKEVKLPFGSAYVVELDVVITLFLLGVLLHALYNFGIKSKVLCQKLHLITYNFNPRAEYLHLIFYLKYLSAVLSYFTPTTKVCF